MTVFDILCRCVNDGIEIEKTIIEIARGFQNSQPTEECLEALTDEVDLELQKHLGENDLMDYSIGPIDVNEDSFWISVLLQYGELDEAGFYTCGARVTIG